MRQVFSQVSQSLNHSRSCSNGINPMFKIPARTNVGLNPTNQKRRIIFHPYMVILLTLKEGLRRTSPFQRDRGIDTDLIDLIDWNVIRDLSNDQMTRSHKWPDRKIRFNSRNISDILTYNNDRLFQNSPPRKSPFWPRSSMNDRFFHLRDERWIGDSCHFILWILR